MAKISIDQLKTSIDTAHSILLTVHVSPDGDAIGSMLAMYAVSYTHLRAHETS